MSAPRSPSDVLASLVAALTELDTVEFRYNTNVILYSEYERLKGDALWKIGKFKREAEALLKENHEQN